MSALTTITNGMTGALARAAINAAIGWLNSQRRSGGLAWVDSNLGNDGTGVAGNPGRPFATVSAAKSAGANVFYLSGGSYDYTPSSDFTGTFFGTGVGLTFLMINGNGADALASTGGDGKVLNLNINQLTLTASANGGNVNTPSAEDPGTGGNGGTINITGDGDVSQVVVVGGSVSGSGTNTFGGNGGSITLKNVKVGNINATGGSGSAGSGTGGNVTMLGCDAQAASLSLDGVTTSVGRTTHDAGISWTNDFGGNAAIPLP